MTRWLVPRSSAARVVIQVVILALATGLTYLIVLWMGSDLGGTPVG